MLTKPHDIGSTGVSHCLDFADELTETKRLSDLSLTSELMGLGLTRSLRSISFVCHFTEPWLPSYLWMSILSNGQPSS